MTPPDETGVDCPRTVLHRFPKIPEVRYVNETLDQWHSASSLPEDEQAFCWGADALNILGRQDEARRYTEAWFKMRERERVAIEAAEDERKKANRVATRYGLYTTIMLICGFAAFALTVWARAA